MMRRGKTPQMRAANGEDAGTSRDRRATFGGIGDRRQPRAPSNMHRVTGGDMRRRGGPAVWTRSTLVRDAADDVRLLVDAARDHSAR